MGSARYAIFSCSLCGKKYAWKPQSAGKTRVCACGHFIAVPLAATADASMAGQSLAGQSVAGEQAFAHGSQAGRAVTGVAENDLSPLFRELRATNPTVTDAPRPSTANLEEVFSTKETTANSEDGHDADANHYTVRDESKILIGPRRPSLAKEIAQAQNEGEETAILADTAVRQQREHAHRERPLRDWVAPCALIVFACVFNAWEIQHHVDVLNATTFIGRSLAFYLFVNAIGMLSGIVIAKVLMHVHFGRFVTAWLKWIAIIVATPAIWVAVVELCLKYHLGGQAPLVMGVVAGWFLEMVVFYALCCLLFEIDPLEVFWTFVAANGVKFVLFLVWVVLKAHFDF